MADRNEALARAFAAGVSIDNLSFLIETTPAEVQERLRDGVSRLIGMGPAVVDEAEPPAKKARATAKKRSTPEPVGTSVHHSPDLDAYPEVLRDPRAEVQRMVYSALTHGPATVSEIASRAQIDSKSAANIVYALRHKGLAFGSEDTPVKWSLVTK